MTRKFKPALRLSYLGPSGAVEVFTISPQAAAKRWPVLFTALLAEMTKAGARQLTLDIPEGP